MVDLWPHFQHLSPPLFVGFNLKGPSHVVSLAWRDRGSELTVVIHSRTFVRMAVV